MKAFEIESQTNQIPFALGGLHPAQRKLAETQDLFDDPDDWFDRVFARAVDRFTHIRLELVSHFHLGACILGWRIR